MESLAPGSRFGNYEILGLVGEGGAGHVYRARRAGARVLEIALKVMAGKLPSDFAARFEREASVIARLEHPGCVRIVDHGKVGERRFIAMELLAGPTLADVLASDGQLPVERAVAIARDLLAALAHAHRRGVIHRDVKPDNVMLVARGAVLVDFGFAALRDAGPLTKSGMCVGSPSYIAPERLLGKPHDERTDLYAVGVILYEMLAGLRPFVGSTPEQIMEHALTRPPRPLRVSRADVPVAIEAIVMRALAKDPARRFDDAAAMLWALVDATTATLAPPAPPVTAPRPRPAPPRAADSGSAACTMLELALVRSRWSRLVAWLRYGRWRWRYG